MKKNVIGLATLICLGVLFQSCEKEESPISSSLKTSEPTSKSADKSGVQNQKSAFSLQEYASMAGNVQSITFDVVDGSYTFDLYNSATTYILSVDSYDSEVLIEYTLDDNLGNSYDIDIDVISETIYIESEGTYTFNNYELNEFLISSSSSELKNIMVIGTTYIEEKAGTSSSFVDNGSLDTYPSVPGGPTDPAGLAGFWRTHRSSTPCSGGMEAHTITRERFGMAFTKEWYVPC